MSSRNHDHRRYLILNLIYRFGPVSRTELIAYTDYRPATVGEIIKELLDEQLIVEAGRLSTGHGRRRAMLELNKDFICSIGIATAPRRVSTVMAQLDGKILCRYDDEVADNRRKDELTECVANRVREMLRTYGDRKIVGIGVGDPLYDPSCYSGSGTLTSNYEHFNDWVKFNLKPRLEELSNLPVKTFSPAMLPTLASMRFGAARGARDFFCVELSNGVGLSICANGSPVTGANGVAGELGHTVVDLGAASGKLCYCGKPGCVEIDTAYPAIVRDIRDALNRGVYSSLCEVPGARDELSLSDIRRALDEGDTLCRFHVGRAARCIGAAIANAVNLLNPELVVLYGFMLELGDFFTGELSKSIRENTLVLANKFEIRTSPTLLNSLPLGAAAEMFTSFLRSDDYNWIFRIAPEAAEATLAREARGGEEED